MAKVTGLGGVFYKVSDPAATQAWYRDVFEIGGEWGVMFPWSNEEGKGGQHLQRPAGELSQHGLSPSAFWPTHVSGRPCHRSAKHL